MSMIPAFSPGPCSTRWLRVGKRFKWTREDLYEQCSLHITLKIPSSVNEGSRPSSDLMRSNSSGVIPWSRRTSGVIAGVAKVVMWGISIVAFSYTSAKKQFHRKDRRVRRENWQTFLNPWRSRRARGWNGCVELYWHE